MAVKKMTQLQVPNLIEAARVLPSVFAQVMRPKFIMPEHLKPIDDALYYTVNGDLKRIIITMPRRHGKTYLTSETYPLWFIGCMERRGITVEVMSISYNQQKSNDISRSVRDLFNHPDFNRVFPATTLKEGNEDVQQWSTAMGSKYYAVGVGGSCTGRGANLLLIDDAFKNAEEALSEGQRHKIHEWYDTAAANSLYENGIIIHIGTRWHSDDLIGHCLKVDEDSDQALQEDWLLIHQQALIDEGTDQERPLWPYDPVRRLGFSMDYLKKRRAKDARWWSTQYRGIPIDVAADCLGTPSRGEPNPMPTKLFCFVDTAFDGKDSSAYCIGGMMPDGRIAILRADIQRVSSVELAPTIARVCTELGVRSVIVEKNADKGWTGATIRKLGLHVLDIPQNKNKIGRIQHYVQTDFKKKFLFSERCTPAFITALSTWWELSSHDDAPDAVAGLAEYLLDKSKRVSVLPTDLFRG